MGDHKWTRRDFLTRAAVGGAFGGWMADLAAQTADRPVAKACILLWMAGGPSHLDTFDLKPEAPAEIRGEFESIQTSVNGIEISEHFPQFARLMHHTAVLRGMRTIESDHQLATYHVHTGYQREAGGIEFPSFGSVVARELGQPAFPLPNYVCIGGGPRQATRSGFLGPTFQPLNVSDPNRGIDFIAPLTGRMEFERRHELLHQFESSFQSRYDAEAGRAHASAVQQAVRLMTAEQSRAFDLSMESDVNRERYGRSSFGQGCLMARRLVETGVPFVEVLMGDGVGWDTHRDNFPRTRELSVEADRGMAALIEDLEALGRLDSTLVIWLGEFGRSPQITSGGGRNHWARAWSSLLIGGGIRGGQVIGRTDRDATEVIERPISVPDFLATVCSILGMDHTEENFAPGVERPIPIVDSSDSIAIIDELL